jgi:hypothetical protein
MWMNTQSYTGRFIFFYFKEFNAINNDRKSRLFDRPFLVSRENKETWANSGKSRLLASEALTRWDFN